MVLLALIVNEILSNSFRQRFPGRTGRGAVVEVELCKQSRETAIECGDSGQRYGSRVPIGVEFRTHDSLGFDLVRLLAAQLHAEVECDTGAGGTEFRISFPLSVEK